MKQSYFVNIDNFANEYLWKEGSHLPNSEKSTLANNFMNHLNNFY